MHTSLFGQTSAGGEILPHPNDFETESFLYVSDTTLIQNRVSSLHARIEDRYGFKPKLVAIEDVRLLAMMLDSGQGVTLLNYWSRPRQLKNMHFISLDISERVAMACMKNSQNPIAVPFMDESPRFFAEHIHYGAPLPKKETS